jgi:hypothetical protein
MSSALVFVISFFSCLLLLILERLVGIGWDFHPDAVTYTQKHGVFVQNIFNQGLSGVPNNLYFLVAYLLKGNVILLTSLNIFSYCVTNILISQTVRKYSRFWAFTKEKKIILLIILLFMPYRMHLAIHVLKDTLIILFFVMCAVNSQKKYIAVLAFIPMFLTRVIVLFYIAALQSKKVLAWATPFMILFVAVYYQEITNFLIGQNELKMTFREFDNVPTFQNMGLIGTVIRGFVWPIFNLTGIYLLFSPSVMFFPLALGSMMLQFWSYWVFRKFAFTLNSFLVMMFIAFLVPGFTSYLRYCYPLLVVLPLLILKSNTVPNRDRSRQIVPELVIKDVNS